MSVTLAIGGRTYPVACKPGGEDHLRMLAALVDQKVAEARAAVGEVTEARQLLFAALLLADALNDTQPATNDPPLTNALEALAMRVEAIADALEEAVPAS